MDSPTPRTQRQIVDFPPNTPVQVALRFRTGKFVPTRTEKQRVMYTLTDDRVMFLDPGPAEQLNQLGPEPGEPIFIRKDWSGKRNEAAQWVVWLSTDAEKRRAVDQARREGRDMQLVSRLVIGAATPGSGAVHSGGAAGPAALPRPAQPSMLPSWAQVLLSTTNSMVDVYAAAVDYAAKHGGTVKPEDVLSLMNTAFARLCDKKGAPNAA